MTYIFRTMVVPDTIVVEVRALADSFGPTTAGMWTCPLSPNGNLPATHWISSGMVADNFAAVMPFSHVDHSVPPAWVTDPYDPTSFVTLCQSANVIPLPVEQITAIMGMVDVSDQEPFIAMERMGLVIIVPESFP